MLRKHRSPVWQLQHSTTCGCSRTASLAPQVLPGTLPSADPPHRLQGALCTAEAWHCGPLLSLGLPAKFLAWLLRIQAQIGRQS